MRLSLILLLLLSFLPLQAGDSSLSEWIEKEERLSSVLSRLKAAKKKLEALENTIGVFKPRYLDIASRCEGRLTLASGTPVTTSDLSAQATLYFTPFHGSVVSLYDGSTWTACNFTQLSISVGSIASGSTTMSLSTKRGPAVWLSNYRQLGQMTRRGRRP